MNHLQLVEDAKVAIERLFSDTSVTRKDTILSLQEILEDLEIRIETLIDEDGLEDED